jgi:hypothetical protein
MWAQPPAMSVLMPVSMICVAASSMGWS